MNTEDRLFLQSVQEYVSRRPEVGAHVATYVAEGISAALKQQAAKSADFEIITSFLLRRGKLSQADNEFLVAKMTKWNDLCSLNWSSFIERVRKEAVK